MNLEDLTLERATLESGLRVIIVPVRGLHRVVIDAHLRAGPAFEADHESGLSHFLEHMLYRGTPRHPSAHQQAHAFESLGGTLVAATHVDHGSMAIATPTRAVDDVLELFGEVFLHPVFSGIETEKGIISEEILEGLDEDGNVVDADELVRDLCFGGHPLGRPIIGTRSKLAGFDRSDLERHHRALYVGANTVLCVAGPVDPDALLPRIERAFHELRAGAQPESPALPPQTERRFRYVKHAGSQTDLRLAFRAPADLDPFEPATDLLLRVIDDGMSTRLYHRICDEKGLCYDVSAGYEAYAGGGVFDFAAEVAHERAPEVLAELSSLAQELAASGPSDAELAKAKARLAWHFDAMLDEPADLATFLASGVLSSVAPTLVERREQLLAVTRLDVQRAAERVFDNKQLSVIAVGDGKKREQKRLEAALGRFG